MKSQHRPVLLIVALAFALNLHALAADSLWGDEILTAIFAANAPAEVIAWTATDIHPPLYYLAAGTFTRVLTLFGATNFPHQASDWLWRFPSVVAGVLTVAITYRLAFYLIPNRANKSQLTATAAALLLAVSPIAIKYGQEARMHGLFMCLAALSTWLFFRAAHRPRRWARWLVYALAMTAALYTMYFGFLILAAHAVYSISNYQLTISKHLASKAKWPVIGFGLATGLAFLLYLPWWPVLFTILRKRAAVGAIEGGVGSPGGFLLGVIEALGPMPLPAAWLFFALYLAGLFFLVRCAWPAAAFGAAWLALPTLLPIFLGDPRALQFRYAFVLPVYLTIVAYGVVPISAKLFPGSAFTRRNAITRRPNFPANPAPGYFIWILTTLSFVAVLGIYNQPKPNWRDAAAYLNQHTAPADIILIGPLWDEGRFINYYYRGQAQLLTPAAMVANIERRAEGMRTGGGRVWAVNRFAPRESSTLKNIPFTGVVVSEPQIAVYEPALLTEATLEVAAQAVEAAYPWAAAAEAQGVLNPDPRTAKAAALRAWGDTLMAAGRPTEAITPYQTAVDTFPGWVNGFIALAEAYEQTGNLPAAAENYQKAVLFNINWHGPQANQAAALLEAGEWAAALEKYHQIIGE